MKGKKGARKRDHVVPLSSRPWRSWSDLPVEGDFVFPGGKEGAGLSNAAMSELLKGMGYSPDVRRFTDSVDLQGLVQRADGVSERTFRNGDGAHGFGQGGGRLSSRRHAGQAAPADGGLGGVLRRQGGRRRQRREDRRAQMSIHGGARKGERAERVRERDLLGK